MLLADKEPAAVASCSAWRRRRPEARDGIASGSSSVSTSIIDSDDAEGEVDSLTLNIAKGRRQGASPHLVTDPRCSHARDASCARASAAALESASSIHGSLFSSRLEVVRSVQNNRSKGLKMKKPVYLTGLCVLAAAVFFIWSQNAPVSSFARTASVSHLPHQAETLGISPAGIDVAEMHQAIKALPEEKFHDMTFVFSRDE